MSGRLLLIPLLAVACDRHSPFLGHDDDDGDDTPAGADTDVAHAWPRGVDFGLHLGDDPIGCDEELAGLGTTKLRTTLEDARLYVSDLVLSGPSGEHAFVPDKDLPWQDDTWALLDFEDATGNCATLGTAETNRRISGELPDGDWDTLTFTVGLPHDAAHQPIEAAAPPLDVQGLYRTAQLGRTFLKLDLRFAAGGPSADWSAHVASDGCVSSSANVPPEQPCTRPALARVSVPFTTSAADVRPVVVLDLAELLATVDLDHDQGGGPGCLSQGDDAYECGPIFATLGMAWGTAACVDGCADQTAFRTVCRSLDGGAYVPCP